MKEIKMPKRYLFFLLFLFLANVFTWWIIIDFKMAKEKVVFLNVGQGDAELIKNAAGNILIDAGPNNKILFELGKILPFYDRTLDLFILSHPNKDHFNGLFEVLDKYKIRAVMLNNFTYPSSSFQKLLEELKKRHILIIKGFEGVRISWPACAGRQKQDRLLVIYPPENLIFSNNPNNSCLVLDLSLDKNQFLFTGDISSTQEKKLSSFLTSLQNQYKILKVAHHGSNYSSSDLFLKTFKPQIAIIEVGENSYNQPHPDVLKRLKDIGAQVFRTDINGTIKFILESNALKMKIEQE
ncbi:MAG: MBL fold metallo-hydrolase [Candidatus Berkelbacteria bacterium]|nr:MBL fold metallo-hydrolase [Candidatus Berkelbacteria bacterium]